MNKIIENQNFLREILEKNRDLISTVPNIKQFEDSFIELSNNDYLVSQVLPNELVRFCVNINKKGINLNQIHIVPFNTKINGVYIMLPQAIMPLEALQEEAYKSKFYFRVYEVYEIDGNIVSEKEMDRVQQSKLNTSNPTWFNKHFKGFDAVLIDLEGKIPEQIKFVEVAYVQEVTKTLKDARFTAQSWRHKAARRAFGDFFVPLERRFEVFSALEKENDMVLQSNDVKHIPESLEEIGLISKVINNVEIVEGKTLGKTDALRSLGYTLTNNQWVKQAKNPARELFGFLIEQQLTKKQAGKFVNEILGLTSSDTDGINEVLEDKESLCQSIEEFKTFVQDDIVSDMQVA